MLSLLRSGPSRESLVLLLLVFLAMRRLLRAREARVRATFMTSPAPPSSSSKGAMIRALPVAVYGDEASRERIDEIQRKFAQLAKLSLDYRPTGILPATSLFDTIWPEVVNSMAPFRLGKGLQTKRQIIQLPEFEKNPNRVCCPAIVPPGLVSIDWVQHEQTKSAEAIVVLIPGLTGSSDSLYIQTTAQILARAGFLCACYNPRGRGGNVVDTPFLYSVGYTEDIRRVFEIIFSEHPTKEVLAIGFSLGGGVLAKYVGEESGRCRLKAAATICSPIDCIPMSNHITHSTLGRLVIDPMLVSFVKEMTKMHQHILKGHPSIDLESVLEARTMWEFDGSIIAPMMGFRSASEYYRRSSAGMLLYDISIPMMFIHADNDPIVPGPTVRPDDFLANPYLLSIITKEGGHSMVFPETRFLGEDAEKFSWSARMIMRFCSTFSSSAIRV